MGRFRTRCKDGVGDHGRGCHDGDHLVEKVRGVFLEDAPKAGGLLPEQHEFMTALAERKEQRQQRRTRQEPGPDQNIDSDCSRDGRQHESRDRRHRSDRRGADRERTRSDRPRLLQWMPSIAFAIGDVIDQIHGPRQGAEHGKCRTCEGDGPSLKEPAAKEQSGKQEQILRPLLGTK